MEALLLGLLTIGFKVGVVVLVVLIIYWALTWFGVAVPDQIQKIVWALVGLFAVILLVQLLFGITSTPLFNKRF